MKILITLEVDLCGVKAEPMEVAREIARTIDAELSPGILATVVSAEEQYPAVPWAECQNRDCPIGCPDDHAIIASYNAMTASCIALKGGR